jgi:hypothetical protein
MVGLKVGVSVKVVVIIWATTFRFRFDVVRLLAIKNNPAETQQQNKHPSVSTNHYSTKKNNEP